jgi:hypothetical protein
MMMRTGVGLAVAAALLLAGCSGDGALPMYVKADTSAGLPPVPPGGLVGAEGTCADAPEGAAAATKLDFGLTECEVLRLVGPIDKVEIGDTSGVRVVTMTSIAGAKPGVYRFEAGRLKSLDGMPEPEKKKAKPKH